MLKPMMIKKMLAALLAGVMLCGSMAACKKSAEPPAQTQEKPSETVTDSRGEDGTDADTPADTDAETLPREEGTEEDTEPVAPPDDTLAGKYGEMIQALNGNYANYRFAEVTKTPALDISFDTTEDLAAIPNDGSRGGVARVVNAEGAGLIAGRFELRKALDLTGRNTYVSAPDLGEMEALTISMWVNLRDISSRASDDDTRVTTLLDTQTGTGRVTLSLVHTGATLNTVEPGGALVSNPKETKLVFSVEGNAGGTFEESGLYAKNSHYSNFESTIPEVYNTWIAHEVGHCWFHIGIVYNPADGTVTFYHEGKLDSTQAFTTAVKPVMDGIRLGGGYIEGQSLDGRIDDIRIYGEALPAEDIELLADFERDMWVYRTIADWEESETVFYVDGVNGSDDNPGTKDAPFATVKKGVESITQAGTRLVIAPGVYREAGINLNASGTEDRPIIIEAEVPGKTIINGSVALASWETTAMANVYRHDWDYRLARQTSSVPGNEILARSDMIWVDGEPMRPVFSMEELTVDSYYLDEAAGEVYLMTEKSPDAFVAEASVLGSDGENNKGAYLLKTNSNEYFVLRGLTFTAAGTVLWDHSMVSLGLPHHVLVEDCSFTNTNTAGIGWDSGWIGRTAEDILIRRCSFDNNGTSAIGVGFRTMNLVVEDCLFTDIGWKIDWGEYNSPDPATVKMMVCKNVTYRGNRFDNNVSNDLWFDNFNWNINVEGNVFTRNRSDVGVHIEIDVPGVRIRNNVMEGGVRWANAEGLILEGNVFYGEKELICTWDSGAEFRYGDFGPIYGWDNAIILNNVFYYTGEENNPIVGLPKYRCALDMYSAGNKLYTKGLTDKNRSFTVGQSKMKFGQFLTWIGDTTSEFLTEDPFADDGSTVVSFRDTASVAHGFGVDNYVPVTLSHALQKETTVSYTVWDYDTNEIIRTGELTFGAYESEKTIRLWEYDRNVLIELTSAEGMTSGEGMVHYQQKAQ